MKQLFRMALAGWLCAACGLLYAAPKAIPFKQESTSAGEQGMTSLAMVLLVGLAAYGATYYLKRHGAGRTGLLRKENGMRIIEVLRLSRRSTLYRVQYQGRELLFAESDNGLHQLPDQLPGAAADA